MRTREELIAADEACDCPHCGEGCDRESVDVGIGIMHGPWGCGNCGWSSSPEYDSRVGIRRDGAERVYDQWGVSHHRDRIDGVAVLGGLNVQERGARKVRS